MIIKSITLKNFKSHKNTQIKLNTGVSIILGSNGAGKSTILEALSYALFKQFNGRISEVMRKKSNEQDIIKEMKVTVNFNHNGKDYRLIRGKRGSSNIAELEETSNKNGLYINGDTKVTKEIEQIIGVDKNSYLNAVYIKQGEITELIEKTAGERKELIGKLLNIDNLQKSWENFPNITQKYMDKINHNNGQLEKEEDDLKLKEETENKIKKLEEEIDKDNTILKNKKDAVDKKEKEVEELKLKENKYKNFTTRLSEIKENIQKEEKNKKNQEENLKNIEKCEEENKELEKKIKPLADMKEMKQVKQEYDNIKKDLKNINEKIENINKQKKILDDTKENYESYNESTKKLEEIKLRKEETSKEKQKLDLKKEEMEKAEIKKKELHETIKKIVETAHKILDSTFKNPVEVEETINNQLIEYQKKIDENNKLINKNNIKISSYNTEIRNTKKSLNELEKTENTCPICQSEITDDKHKELSKQYQQIIIDNQEKIHKLEEDNNKYSEDNKAVNDEIDRINTIDTKLLSKKYEEFLSTGKIIKELQEELRNYNSVNEEFNKINNEVDELNNKIKEFRIDYENHITAEKILKDYDIDLLNSQKEILDKKLEEKHNDMQTLKTRIPMVDNLSEQIKYLEKEKENFEKNQGIIMSKPTLEENIKHTDNNLTQQNNQLNNINKEIKELSFDEEYYQKSSAEYTSAAKELEKLKEEYIKKENDLEHEKKSLDSINETLKEYKNIHKQQENLKDYIMLLEDIRKLYSKDGIQKDLRKQVKPSIEIKTKKYFDQFGFGYKDIQLDDEYEMTITNMEDEEIPIAMLSGGERIILALSLRLAIAEVISKTKTDLLILDEPTIHLDGERRDELVEILRELNVAPQMIVITHDEGMEGISDNIIKIKKTDGISSVEENTIIA